MERGPIGADGWRALARGWPAHLLAVAVAATLAVAVRPPDPGPRYQSWTLFLVAPRDPAALSSVQGTQAIRQRQSLANGAAEAGVTERLPAALRPGDSWEPKVAVAGDYIRLTAAAPTPELAQAAAAAWGEAFAAWVNGLPARGDAPAMTAGLAEAAHLPGAVTPPPREWTPAPALAGALGLALSLLTRLVPAARRSVPTAEATPAAAGAGSAR